MRLGEENWMHWDWGGGQEDGLGEAIGHPRGVPMSSFLEVLIFEGLIRHPVPPPKK